jgi:hypothetical protein
LTIVNCRNCLSKSQLTIVNCQECLSKSEVMIVNCHLLRKIDNRQLDLLKDQYVQLTMQLTISYLDHIM